MIIERKCPVLCTTGINHFLCLEVKMDIDLAVC